MMRVPAATRFVRAAALLVGLAALTLGLAALALGLAACGHAAPPPSPTASAQGDLPPAWVQKEVAWQSLAYGDAHPRVCSWTVIRARRLAFLVPFFTPFPGVSKNAVYFCLLSGSFRSADTPRQSGPRMYLVLQKQGHSYLAYGIVPMHGPAVELPPMHDYRPVVPVSTSVWGHTLAEGGPAPGGPYQARNAPVTVYAGKKASGSPLATVRSDADGFFTLDLKPGTYTFVMTGKPYTATTATVRADAPPLAVAVVLQMF